MTHGEAARPPSWEQILAGTHPSFRTTDGTGVSRGLARHGRGAWRSEIQAGDVGSVDLADLADLPPEPEDDAMGWGEAVTWTVLAAGVTMLAASAGGLLR